MEDILGSKPVFGGLILHSSETGLGHCQLGKGLSLGMKHLGDGFRDGIQTGLGKTPQLLLRHRRLPTKRPGLLPGSQILIKSHKIKLHLI
jgi:hypothetical protein